ncbi:MAG TPA: hypothetical protein VFW79_14100 [Cellulomonas sp.]|uniref:hypothetical protein n=1 Tax=Cellulomonas sp. TaxID=40001 RepID=UPI002E3197FF|nr:hypothetical protein [Cellulomonas sp.]HEX5333767.1 hypothetical protein [Cellulomonas sp.]
MKLTLNAVVGAATVVAVPTRTLVPITGPTQGRRAPIAGDLPMTASGANYGFRRLAWTASDPAPGS